MSQSGARAEDPSRSNTERRESDLGTGSVAIARRAARLGGVTVIVAQMTLEPEPLESVAPGVPSALARVVHSCLSKDPSARPRTAKELARRLRDACPDDPWDSEQAAAWWASHPSAA